MYIYFNKIKILVYHIVFPSCLSCEEIQKDLSKQGLVVTLGSVTSFSDILLFYSVSFLLQNGVKDIMFFVKIGGRDKSSTFHIFSPIIITKYFFSKTPKAFIIDLPSHVLCNHQAYWVKSLSQLASEQWCSILLDTNPHLVM